MGLFLLKSIKKLNKALNSQKSDTFYQKMILEYLKKIKDKIENSSDYRSIPNIIPLLIYFGKDLNVFLISVRYLKHPIYLKYLKFIIVHFLDLLEQLLK